MNDDDGQYIYHPLENIEDVDLFYEAVEREHLTSSVTPERPYTYWTIELYDQENGIRGGGGLGILAADTRRVAEQNSVPFTLITPFYPSETKQVLNGDQVVDEHVGVDYHKYGFRFVDNVYVHGAGNLCKLDVIEKVFGSTRIICITEPNFGELYSGLSSSDHRLYQEVCLGFGGYLALKLIGLKPAVMQLNEVATFFAALARLDELVRNGMDFYEAVVYTRKHTLYTNHTLVQAAEAEFGLDQFERYVFPNLKSLAVKKWMRDKFVDGRVKLSSVTIEIAELRSGVSKLHTRVANYHDIAGNKVKFKAITNGIDMRNWVLPDIRKYLYDNGVLDKSDCPTPDFQHKLDVLTADKIRELKSIGRFFMNRVLKYVPDQYGQILRFNDTDFVFNFRRRFVDYKRPELVFQNPARLRQVLEKHGAHYILAGRVHAGDSTMMGKLQHVLRTIDSDDYLRTHVHYLANYDERVARALSVGCNAAINIPIVGYEACGTSWMKDVANFGILISTHDGGVADGSINSYLNVSGSSEAEELDSVYRHMEDAPEIWSNDFDLEYIIKTELDEYLPVISGTRMLREYLDFIFKK